MIFKHCVKNRKEERIVIAAYWDQLDVSNNQPHFPCLFLSLSLSLFFLFLSLFFFVSLEPAQKFSHMDTSLRFGLIFFRSVLKQLPIRREFQHHQQQRQQEEEEEEEEEEERQQPTPLWAGKQQQQNW